MSDDVRFTWEINPDLGGQRSDDSALCHTTIPLFTIYGFDLNDEDRKRRNSLQALLDSVPGVRYSSVEKYQVAVHKARLFDWSDVQPMVEHAVRSWHAEDTARST